MTTRKYCYHCGTEWDGINQPSIKESCTTCAADLHVCRNCALYDTSKSNDCATETDPVSDKERFNYCEEFIFTTQEEAQSGKIHAPASNDARAKFDALFKK